MCLPLLTLPLIGGFVALPHLDHTPLSLSNHKPTSNKPLEQGLLWGKEEPFPARRLSGREGWTPVLRWSADERQGCAVSSLRAAGKIRAWGVSNFKVSDMEELFRVSHGDRCATNQVLYNLGNRGIEHDLLPWCEQHGMPVMAYSPLGGAGASLLRDSTLARIGAARGCSAAAVALAWTIRNGNVIAIPESGSAEHVKENAVALSLTLTPDELHALDAAHPPPIR
jgi:diketogulonate reductase-like aldo/keto reductase